MRKLLKEHFKDLLKEEIDYSSKTATVYHLTGFKTADYDSVYAGKMKKTSKDLHDEISDKRPAKKRNKAQSILAKVEYKAAMKDLEKFKTPQGQAYYIGKKIKKGNYQLGSTFMPGGGAMYAEGLYTCYNLNPAIARTYGSVILRFEVDISNFFIFNAGIAKGVYGDNFRLEDQFFEMCKKKNVDLRGFYNQEVSLDISPDANNALSDYIEMLTQMSNRPEFLNSDIDTNLRTAPMALHALKEYSKQFHNGQSGLLRDVIDGIIFFGLGDGPVCVIYYPNESKNYKLTGAGYFDKKGNPIIENELEKLIGRSGSSLKDTFDFSKEVDEESIEDYKEKRSENLKQRLANFSKEQPDLDGDFFEKFPTMLYNILDPLQDIYGEATEDLIISRVNDTQPEFDNYCKDTAEAYKYIQFICSILAEPILQFIDTFGPGLDIVSKDEFETYCYIFKQYAMNSVTSGGPTPSLADFQSNNLKCVAENDEEFNRLVEQELRPLTDSYNNMFDEGLASEFVNLICGDTILSGNTCVINNSITMFKIDEVSLSTENDGQSLEDSLRNKTSIISDVEQKLLDLFDNEQLKTPQGIMFLKNTFKHNELINVEKEGLVNGTLNFEKIAEDFGWYSNSCIGGGDIFYTLYERAGGMDTGAGAYVINRETFDPEFILQKMYNIKKDWALKEAVGLSRQMFKEGRKAFDSANSLSFDFVKKRVMDDKIDNLAWVVEDLFSLPLHREKILI